MDVRIQIVSAILAGLLLLVLLELVRRRRLLERYALLWLFSALVLLGLAIWRDGLEEIGGLLGIASPTNALFFVAFAFVLVLLLHFSIAVSRLSDQSKVLAQRAALLQEELRRAQRRADDAERAAAGSAEEADEDEPARAMRP